MLPEFVTMYIALMKMREASNTMAALSAENAEGMAGLADLIESRADMMPDAILELAGEGEASVAMALLKKERAAGEEIKAMRTLRRTLARLSAKRRGIVG